MERRLERLAQTSSTDASNGQARRRTHRAEVVVSSEEPADLDRRPMDANAGSRRPNSAMTFDSVKTPVSRVPAAEVGEDMEMDDEDVDDRRARLKSLLLERQAERMNSESADRGPGPSRGVAFSNMVDNQDEEDEEEEEEEEEESEEETVTIRPTFVKKSQRSTLKDEETLAKEAEEEKLKEEAAEAQRREQTKEMLAAESAREEEAKLDLVDGLIEDIEKLDDADHEYELWKVRELTRLKRDKEAENKLDAEREGVEERKGWSDERVMRERKAEQREARERGEVTDEPKQYRERKVMQRYYHKGAFFQEDMAKLSQTHDWEAPTGEDNWFNRTSELDSVKYKKYGSVKNVKTSSLREQDTTRRDSPPHYGQSDRKRPREHFDDRQDDRRDDNRRRDDYKERERGDRRDRTESDRDSRERSKYDY